MSSALTGAIVTFPTRFGGVCALVAAMSASLAVSAQRQDQPVEVAAYQRALYPNGLPQKVNPLSDSKAQTEFALDARALLPNSTREVIVYSEWIAERVPFDDKVHWVYVALLEKRGNTFRVLDRSEVTGELKEFNEFPGHFILLRALVTPFTGRDATIAAVEVETTLSGSGSLNDASHFFYSISREGKLARVLTLDSTSGSGRSGPEASATIATLKVGVARDISGDIVLETRGAEWNAFDDPPEAKCGPVTTAYYRFTGSRYVRATPRTIAAGSFKELPVLPTHQITCAK